MMNYFIRIMSIAGVGMPIYIAPVGAASYEGITSLTMPDRNTLLQFLLAGVRPM